MIVSSRTVFAAGAALAVALPSAAAAQAGSPQVKAHPRHVMVDTSIQLKGKGFPADETIQLRECGRLFWLAPETPCDTGNAIAVTTDAKGRFTTPFEAELCPDGETGRHPTERICWVGELSTGEDTGSLVGAVELKVSYP